MIQLVKKSVYSLLDILTLGKGIPRTINGFRVLFPPKWSRYFESDYENENVKFLKKNCGEGMTVIDIGAHLGLLSVTMGQLVGKSGKIYAFEPTPDTFNTLSQVVRINNLSDTVECVNKAVSDTNGQIDFFISSTEGSNANSLVQRHDAKRASLKIDTITIDTFIQKNKINKIDILKIDAEGVEYSVLRGGQETFKKLRPKVILAIHPSLIINNNDTLENIYNLIKELNYEIYYHDTKLDSKTFCTMNDFFDVHLLPTLI